MAEKTFTIKCTMEERWIPEFLDMLNTMELWGMIGHSGLLGFYSDGDGDFRPMFKTKQDYDTDRVIAMHRKETIERYKDSATLIETSPCAIPEILFDAG